MRFSRLLRVTAVATFPLAALALGCGDDTAAITASGPDGSLETGTPTESGTSTDAGDSGTDAGSLYEQLGEHAGIRAALDAIVGQELTDPDIASYFFNQVATPIPAGHPTTDQITECFTDLLSKVAGGPEAYPTTVTDDAGSFTCRDMMTIHKSLNISGGTFDKFVMIAAAELGTLKVSTANITAIGDALNGTKGAIVSAPLADAGEIPYSPYSAGTGDGGLQPEAGTLYLRLGEHGGIRTAINAIVGQELTDPEIASYFFNQVASPVPTGHPAVDQLEECFTSLLGHAAGGPEDYPLAVVDDAGSFTCRDMTTIHAPLHISGGTLDSFVMIAAMELTSLGVAPADVNTVGTVLNGTKPDIVQSDIADAGELPYDAARQ
jgi:hypothetical protein